MKSNVALIGFMGVGKTAVAQILATRLGKSLVEVDELIKHRARMNIPEIFAREGEIGFRQREIEAIREVSGRSSQIIDCGGGVVLNKINVDRLKLDSVVVWLVASARAVLERTQSAAGSRPILKKLPTEEEIQGLISFRRPYYRSAADITVNTSRLRPETVAEHVLLKLKVYADQSF
jgi:shikimate kinase